MEKELSPCLQQRSTSLDYLAEPASKGPCEDGRDKVRGSSKRKPLYETVTI